MKGNSYFRSERFTEKWNLARKLRHHPHSLPSSTPSGRFYFGLVPKNREAFSSDLSIDSNTAAILKNRREFSWLLGFTENLFTSNSVRSFDSLCQRVKFLRTTFYWVSVFLFL